MLSPRGFWSARTHTQTWAHTQGTWLHILDTCARINESWNFCGSQSPQESAKSCGPSRKRRLHANQLPGSLGYWQISRSPPTAPEQEGTPALEKQTVQPCKDLKCFRRKGWCPMEAGRREPCSAASGGCRGSRGWGGGFRLHQTFLLWLGPGSWVLWRMISQGNGMFSVKATPLCSLGSTLSPNGLLLPRHTDSWARSLPGISGLSENRLPFCVTVELKINQPSSSH